MDDKIEIAGRLIVSYRSGVREPYKWIRLKDFETLQKVFDLFQENRRQAKLVRELARHVETSYTRKEIADAGVDIETLVAIVEDHEPFPIGAYGLKVDKDTGQKHLVLSGVYRLNYEAFRAIDLDQRVEAISSD
jgi:hypothetical protein